MFGNMVLLLDKLNNSHLAEAFTYSVKNEIVSISHVTARLGVDLSEVKNINCEHIFYNFIQTVFSTKRFCPLLR